MTLGTSTREQLLECIKVTDEDIRDHKEIIAADRLERAEYLEELAPMISPVSVGDRLLFERRKKGDRIGYGYRSRSGPYRYQAECWEVTEIGARTHGRFDHDDDPVDLHWTATLVRILKSGDRGKGTPYRVVCREGAMIVPHLYDEFKVGSALPTRGSLEIETIRNFRIEPAAEVER